MYRSVLAGRRVLIVLDLELPALLEMPRTARALGLHPHAIALAAGFGS